ncbi:MAG: hypothetical protein IIY49_06365 [Eubacterium sp.]|nr:hypothetical protein [Eubacterium sp.]
MKKKRLFYRLISIVLIMFMILSNSFCYSLRTVSAEDDAGLDGFMDELEREGYIKDENDIAKKDGDSLENVVLTDLAPNTPQDWAIAYKDGIGWPGFFHYEVEKDIRINNNNVAPNELKIPNAGRYGKDGRADIYKETVDSLLIWDIKPASNGYWPLSEGAVNQVKKYVKADNRYKLGDSAGIKSGNLEVTTPSGVTYQVTYKSGFNGCGIIFYRFTRIGNKNKKKEKAKAKALAADEVLVRERKKQTQVVTVDERRLDAFIIIANTLACLPYSSSESDVITTMRAESQAFLINLGKKLAKRGLTIGVGGLIGVGAFSNSKVFAAENDLTQQEINEINGYLDDYDTVLELFLPDDQYAELIEAISGEDEEAINDLIKGIQDENSDYEKAGKAQPPRDPLIIDLGNDGIELKSLLEGVNFDLDRNGFAEKTAWIGEKDGFLALDRNNNGKIDNGGELFGDKVILYNGRTSSSGFEALEELDSNGDKVIDINDSKFDELLIWIDENHNGISEKEELGKLSEHGIKEISLEKFEDSIVDENSGTMMAEYGSVKFEDDSETTIGEFWFPVNSAETTNNDKVTSGNVLSLDDAIEKDESDRLLEYVNSFISADDIVLKRYYTKKVLYFLTDSEDIAVGSRGGNIDARDLHVIEQFMGREFVGVGGTCPNSNAAGILKNIYLEIEDYYYNILNEYDSFGVYKKLIIKCDDDGNKTLNVAGLDFLIDQRIKSGQNVNGIIYDLGIYLKSYDRINGTKYYQDFYDCYHSIEKTRDITEMTNDSGVYIGTDSTDRITGDGMDNYIFGEAYDDILYGGSGKDTIYGGSGDDTISGDAGDDYLVGAEGNDKYIVNKSTDNDRIYDNAGSNTITFEGISSKDVFVNGTGTSNATIYIKDTNSTVTLIAFTKDEIFSDYTLVFSDVTMHCKDEMSPFRHIYGTDSTDKLRAVVDDTIINAYSGDDIVIGSDGKDIIYGNEGNDNISAGASNDTIYGGEGNDVILGETGSDYIFAGDGDDIIDGGEGDDFLFGGTGDDTYIFKAESGIDIIDDLEGKTVIKLENVKGITDISLLKNCDDYIIQLSDSDICILAGAASKDENIFIEIEGKEYPIKDYVSENASNLSWERLEEQEENKEVSSQTDAGLSDDISSATDAVEECKAPCNVKDAEVFVIGSENSDAIFSSADKKIISSGDNYDYIVCGNLNDHIFSGEDTDRVIGNEGDDVIYGGAGNDQLFGDDGNDMIIGGAGNDYINAGNGDDILVLSAGDDFIDGGAGDDIYYINLNGCNNRIYDLEGSNTIIFGDGIKSDKIKAVRDNWNDLKIYLTGENSGDSLIIKDYCINEEAREFKLIFEDGLVQKATDKESILRTVCDLQNTEYSPSIYDDGMTLVSSSGDDQLNGSNSADTLIGGDGANRIIGNDGDDSLSGGKNKDYLSGGNGNDTYIYHSGDGSDTISDNSGENHIEITEYNISDIVAYRTNWNDLTIVLDGSGENGLYDDNVDKIVLEGFYVNENNRHYTISMNGTIFYATSKTSPLRKVNGLSYSEYMTGFDNDSITLFGNAGDDNINGTDAEDTLYGGEGNDRILSAGGNDTLSGGSGDDYLEGGAGADTYIVSEGCDTISDNSGNNIIKIISDYSDSVILERHNWNDLFISYGDNKTLIISGYFVLEENRNYTIQFNDGKKYIIKLSDDGNSPSIEVAE